MLAVSPFDVLFVGYNLVFRRFEKQRRDSCGQGTQQHVRPHEIERFNSLFPTKATLWTGRWATNESSRMG
jgi:hypothetical protein